MAIPQPIDILPLWGVYLLTVLIALLAAEAGYQLGKALRRRSIQEKEGTLGSQVGASLAMLAFLLAFFTGIAANRFDARRQLIVDEANAIGTTYLRAGYLEEPYRTEIRSLLREYVDVRLAASDREKLQSALSRSEQIHAELWTRAEGVAKSNSQPVMASIFIQSLNDVIDLHTKRVAAAGARIPFTIWLGIFLVMGFAMLLVGFHNSFYGRHQIIATLVLVMAFSAVILLIADLDHSTEGLLTVSQQPLIDLQRQLNVTSP